MTITLACRLKDIFAKESMANPMCTIPEIEEWLKKRNEFLDSTIYTETSGGFVGEQMRLSLKTYKLRDGSVIRISADGIEEG
jgi:hypothetical protein